MSHNSSALPSETSHPWELFVVSGSHFDLGWCGDPAECLTYSDSIIRAAIDAITGDYPDYRFTVEYAQFMEHFLRRFPGYAGTASELARQGKLEVCPTAVGSMEQILDGELLIRAIVEGHRFVQDTFGVKPLTAQHTDLPGHAWQLPQVLSLAGVRYAAGSRFHPGSVLFRRTAPDGSSVVFANHGRHYNWGYALRRGLDYCLEHLAGQVEQIGSFSPVKQLLMGEEHDLDMPEPSILSVIDELNSRDLPYKLRCATATEFFTSIDPNVELPSYTGEAPYGFYTAPAFEPAIYLTSRRAENALASAEKLSWMRSSFGLGAYPVEELRQGWRALFYPQDHNFAGRHGAANEQQRLNKAIFALDTGETLANEAKLAVAVNIEHQREGFPVTVFNPCSWSRTDTIETKAEFRTLTNAGITVTDSDGTEVPCQLLEIDHARDDRYDFQNSEKTQFTFAFVTADVPALGYRTYYVSSTPEQPDHITPVGASSTELYNQWFLLRFGDGGLESIVRRSDGRELVDCGESFFAEPVVLEDRRADLEEAIEEQAEKEQWDHTKQYWKLPKESLTGRSWRASEVPIELDVIESGAVRAKMRMRGEVLGCSFEQVYTIYDMLPRIDLTTRIDWRGEMHRLVTLPMTFALDDPRITYESPFAAVRLGEDEMAGSYRGIGGREAQKWIDVSGEGAGVTIATASGSHFLLGSSVVPIVLKTSYSTGDAFHKMANKGMWEFSHRVVPHSGDWRREKTYRHGWEHAAPMLDAHFHPPLRTVPSSKRLPDKYGLMDVISDHVVVTAVKRSDCGEGMILRLFDTEGVADPKVRVDFATPPRSVRKVNLLEEPMEDVKQMMNKVCFPMRAWEIATLLVEF